MHRFINIDLELEINYYLRPGVLRQDSEEDVACGCEQGKTQESISIPLSRMEAHSDSHYGTFFIFHTGTSY
jgi:hypothetical protein